MCVYCLSIPPHYVRFCSFDVSNVLSLYIVKNKYSLFFSENVLCNYILSDFKLFQIIHKKSKLNDLYES